MGSNVSGILFYGVALDDDDIKSIRNILGVETGEDINIGDMLGSLTSFVDYKIEITYVGHCESSRYIAYLPKYKCEAYWDECIPIVSRLALDDASNALIIDFCNRFGIKTSGLGWFLTSSYG